MRAELHPSLESSEFSLDDVIFPPQKIPGFEAGEVDLTTQLTKRITLKRPLMSSPMDTVTESNMAILLAKLGGIGVIHYNFPSIEDQMREVEKVRRYEAGFVKDPIVLGPEATVASVFEGKDKNGFYTYPVTSDGTRETPMIGIVTYRDVRYKKDFPGLGIIEVMTPAEKLVTARREQTLDINNIRAANRVIREHNLETLPIVDSDNKVVALVTDRDLTLDEKYKHATKDNNKQLKVLVAVESRLDLARERITAAEAAGASGIVIDARNIYQSHLEIAQFTRENAPGLDIILGNVVTSEVVRLVLNSMGKKIDCFRVGIGTGEVCITTESLGIGRPMGGSLRDIEKTLENFKPAYGHIGLIADGGIKTPHHFVAALSLGADAVMMGSALAGLSESPGRADFNFDKGMMVKRVRGMGSPAVIAERAGSNRYGVYNQQNRFPEGIEKFVAYRGSGEQFINMYFAGATQSLHGLGHRNIEQLRKDGYIAPASRASSKGQLF